MNSTAGNYILMTGATSGLGRVAACTLATLGNTVVALVRNQERGQQLIGYFQQNFKGAKGSLEFILCDLASFESVVEASKIYREKYQQLDMLINNAGVWNFEFKPSKNNIEEIFHVNVLTPYLLIKRFTDLLEKSNNARIINTASTLHYGKIRFDDVEMKQKFSGTNAYRQSKLAIILLTRLLHYQFEERNIGIYSLHPGVVSTNLARNGNIFFKFFFNFGISPEKGAQTLLYLATAPKETLANGAYYSRKRVQQSKPHSNDLKMAHQLMELANKYLEKYI
jgi:NAD(P)-dependent dehydrogenase (short-subunit alcohol dehydrogenase family)